MLSKRYISNVMGGLLPLPWVTDTSVQASLMRNGHIVFWSNVWCYMSHIFHALHNIEDMIIKLQLSCQIRVIITCLWLVNVTVLWPWWVIVGTVRTPSRLYCIWYGRWNQWVTTYATFNNVLEKEGKGSETEVSIQTLDTARL